MKRRRCSFACLTAATYLGRARRSVCVVDARQPRNRFAEASHGFLDFDGSDSQSILAKARDQVGYYPTVRQVEAEAIRSGTHVRGWTR